VEAVKGARGELSSRYLVMGILAKSWGCFKVIRVWNFGVEWWPEVIFVCTRHVGDQ